MVDTGRFFDLENFLLISGISEFSFFAIEHIQQPGTRIKFSEAHFSRYSDYLSDFEHSSRHFVLSKQFTKCCSKLSMSVYYYCFKVTFLVIKAKIILG